MTAESAGVIALAVGESTITTTVTTGPFLFAAALSLAAGVVSFASPCVLPLVPGYLSYLVGLVGAEESDGRSHPGVTVRTKAVRATAMFVLGFTMVFLAESLVVLGTSRFLVGHLDLLTRIGGVVTTVVGAAMLGWIKPMQREVRIHTRPTGRLTGAPLLGAFFAVGWTACIGPALAGVNALAISSDWNGNAWRGLFLVVLYCLGLGIPFLLVAYGFGWATTAVAVLRRHSRTIQIVGAVALITVGVAMMTGLWGHFISWLQYRYFNVQLVL